MDEVGEGEFFVFCVGFVEIGDVDAGEIESVEDAVVVGGGKRFVVPAFEAAVEHHVKFEVKVGAGFVKADAGVAESSDGGTGTNGLAGLDAAAHEVGVERIEGTVAPIVFDDDVFAVVGSG